MKIKQTNDDVISLLPLLKKGKRSNHAV